MGRRLCLFAALCLSPAYPGLAQPMDMVERTDTTLIYAEVGPVCTVETETPVAVVQLIPGLQDVTNVVYTCNNAQGFARRVSSLNGGVLRRDTQGIPYLISQGGTGDLAFALVDLQTVQTDSVTAFPDLVVGSSGMLRVELPAIPTGLLAGEYADTVTIEITPN